ncbi:MAG: hypothetical protein A2X49_07325 [Lentisphaerae bacterium GWF2_52_8]|nr:MAG: hypothetical protein A2X49_07325 [Lentisphaerae bacterium GWF2_52_8]
MGVIDRLRLDGKKALVTGAGRGLGRNFAHALAEAGADVAVVDIIEDNALKVSREIIAKGKKSIAIKADISRTEDACGMVEKVMQDWGRLDVAVNNAGIALKIKNAIDVSSEEWDRILDVNLKGTFFCAQAEAKAMIPNKYGKIINIASICGHIVWPEPQSVYSISKAGVVHLTKCLGAELIKHGIRVNCISPGVTRVEDLFPEVIPVYLRTAPIDHIGEVTDHQGAIIYLASEVSDFMVGQEIVLDGGYTIM